MFDRNGILNRLVKSDLTISLIVHCCAVESAKKVRAVFLVRPK